MPDTVRIVRPPAAETVRVVRPAVTSSIRLIRQGPPGPQGPPGADGGGGADATFPGFFSPQTYGAVGGGVDDTAALVACHAAAKAAGGGAIVWYSARHGFRGDLVHPPRVVVQGMSAVDYTGSGVYPQTGLVALDGTARYVYGQIAQPDSLGDTPGAIRDVVIDGASVGGAGAELFRAECVNGRMENVFVVRSAGNAVCFASTQNSVWTGGHVGECAGAAWVFKERVTGGQGAGANKIHDVYTFKWTTKCIEYAVSSTASFWNHDNWFTDCLFEYFKSSAMDCFVHVDSGDIVFTRCTFTFSQIGATATDDCMVHVTQTAFPGLATTVVFDVCYFAGGVTAPPTDVVKSDGANEIMFATRNVFRGPANVISFYNGATQFRHTGPLVNAGGTNNVIRIGTSGSYSGSFLKMYSGHQYNMAVSGVNPIDIRQPSDSSFRLAFGVTGAISFGDGAGTLLGGIAGRVGGLNISGVAQFVDGVTKQPNVVSGASGAVSLATGANAVHTVIFASNASATLTLTGNEAGREVEVQIQGNGTNTLAWGNTIAWGTAGAPAAPASGVWLVVGFTWTTASGWVVRYRNS